MILIVSEKEDHSTNEVIQWLLYFNAKFIRVNRGDKLVLRKVRISNSVSNSFVILSDKIGEISLENINAFWYRRGEMFFYLPPVDFIQNNELKKQIIRHLIKPVNLRIWWS